MTAVVLEEQRVDLDLEACGRFSRVYRVTWGDQPEVALRVPRLAQRSASEDVYVVANGFPLRRMATRVRNDGVDHLLVPVMEHEQKAHQPLVLLHAPFEELPAKHKARDLPLVVLPASMLTVEVPSVGHHDPGNLQVSVPAQLQVDFMYASLRLPDFSDALAEMKKPEDDASAALVVQQLGDQLRRMAATLSAFVGLDEDRFVLDRRTSKSIVKLRTDIEELIAKDLSPSVRWERARELAQRFPSRVALGVTLTDEGRGRFTEDQRRFTCESVSLAYSQARHPYLRRASRALLLLVAALVAVAVAMSVRNMQPTDLDGSREVAASVLLFVPALMLAEFISMRPRPAALRRAEGPYFTFLSLGLVAPILCSVLFVGGRDGAVIHDALIVAAALASSLAFIAIIATSERVLRFSRALLGRFFLRRSNDANWPGLARVAPLLGAES